MMAKRPECPLACPSQGELDSFRKRGVGIMSLAKPSAMQVAVGDVASDGLFEPHATGQRWFAFEEFDAGDIVFWHQASERIASWSGRAFALGQDIIGDPAIFSFDNALNIFDDPLDWLRCRRDGIVVLPGRWDGAFDRLRDCPRIAIAQRLLPVYRRQMKPPRMPELFV